MRIIAIRPLKRELVNVKSAPFESYTYLFNSIIKIMTAATNKPTCPIQILDNQLFFSSACFTEHVGQNESHFLPFFKKIILYVSFMKNFHVDHLNKLGEFLLLNSSQLAYGSQLSLRSAHPPIKPLAISLSHNSQ